MLQPLDRILRSGSMAAKTAICPIIGFFPKGSSQELGVSRQSDHTKASQLFVCMLLVLRWTPSCCVLVQPTPEAVVALAIWPILSTCIWIMNSDTLLEENVSPENSPTGGHLSIENQQEHPLNVQSYATFDYREQNRKHGKNRVKRKSSKHKHKEKYEIGDDENKDCTKCGFSLAEKGGRVVNGKVVKPLYRYPWINFPEVINSIIAVNIPKPTDISLVWVPF
ncbi:hypothetical protein TNCV_3086161 [Trichonephila clavipes]|nr:hypothetical protein TNCV_3086161 [Trichonephila clavipes]